MITVFALLVLAAFVGVVLNSMGKAPLWPSVFFMTVIELLRVIPLGK